jgi:REP element-mobilizing transposase RayT
MADKRAFKSSNNSVHSGNYHVVWTPRYRRKGLVCGVDVRLKEIVHEVADALPCEIPEPEAMPDHGHRPAEVDPRCAIHRFVKDVKGRSARLVREGLIGSQAACRRFGQPRPSWRRWGMRHWQSSTSPWRTRKTCRPGNTHVSVSTLSNQCTATSPARAVGCVASPLQHGTGRTPAGLGVGRKAHRQARRVSPVKAAQENLVKRAKTGRTCP